MTSKIKLALIAQLIIFIILSIFFFSYNYSFDAVGHALTVESPNAETLFHPYHLIYAPVLLIFYKILRLLTPVSGLAAGQIFSLLSAIISIIIIYKISDFLFKNSIIKIFTAICINFSYWFWYYSMDAELHIPNMLLLLLIILNVIKYFQTNANKYKFIVIILCSIAPAVHQINLFIWSLTFLFFLYYSKEKFKTIYQFIGALIIFTLLPYLICAYFFLDITTPQELIIWLTRYQQKGYWSGITTNYFSETLRGLTFAFIGGGALKMIAVAIMILFTFISSLHSILTHKFTKIKFYLTALLISYSAIVIYWHPSNPENWWALVFLIFLLASALDNIITLAINKIKLLINIFILIFCVYQFYAVFYGYIIKYSNPKFNKHLITALMLKEKSLQNNNAFIVTSGAGEFTHLNIYLPYFAGSNFTTLAIELDANNSNIEKTFESLNTKITNQPEMILFDDLTNSEALNELSVIHKLDISDLKNHISDFAKNNLENKQIIYLK